MTAALTRNASTGTRTRPATADWLGYLADRTSPDWRRGEWNPETLIFTGDVDNPLTTAWACSTPGCPTRSILRNGPCVRCRSARASGSPLTPLRPFREALCGDSGVTGCRVPLVYNGLCPNHQSRFTAAKRKDSTLTVHRWAKTATPFASAGQCAVGWCDRPRRSLNSLLCKGHTYKLRKSGAVNEAQFVADAGPEPTKLSFADFTLAGCTPVMAAIIYGLQQRDRIGLAINPFLIRDLIALIEPYADLAGVDRDRLHRKAIQAVDNLQPHVEVLRDAFERLDVFAPDLWPAHVLTRFPSMKTQRKTATGTLDWTSVECRWLREAGKIWLRDTLPARTEIPRTMSSLRHVSDALKGSAGFQDRTTLGLRDLTAIVQHLSALKNADGTPMSYSHISRTIGIFRVMLTHCRQAGYLNDVPPTFTFTKLHERRRPTRTDDLEPGRAIPDPVIELLDGNLASFTPDYRSSHRLAGWNNDDYGLMWQTIYTIIRDTGRRPGEVTSLRFKCLAADPDGDPILLWDNHKARRPGRRLPIFTSTAAAIRQWQERLTRLAPDIDVHHSLFPAPSAKGMTPTRSTAPGYYSQKFAEWVDSIPGLTDQLADLARQGRPFGRNEITLYGFRHAYAQSLADAGTQPDMLMQLMDHISMQTTSGYYRIGQQRKRAAVDVMSKLRSDIYGRTRPISDVETYQRTEVATVLGGCSEPANVKAGGKSCPIRFQCGACGFYRPDPTYVPEIEDEIRRIRKDIATAELCATRPVVENLEYNLGMLQAVLRKMHDNLAALSAEEQAVYEVFHAEARKSRRLLRLNLTVADAGPDAAK